MSSINFNENVSSLDIVSQTQFESESGVKLNDLIIGESLITLDMIGISVDVDGVHKTDDKTQYSKNGIGVLETADVKSSNTFLNTVQSNVKKKKEHEKEEIRKANPDFPYIKASVMTDAEKQLYHFMSNNLCQIEKLAIFPKVRLADIINLDIRITQDKNALYKICYKHVDFLICHKDTLDTICVIELDDYTHESKEAKDRDMFIMQALDVAGIPVARIRRKIASISRSDLVYADELINRALAPRCPLCGRKMYPKVTRDGHRFYACEDFIECRHTQDIDTRGEKLP